MRTVQAASSVVEHQRRQAPEPHAVVQLPAAMVGTHNEGRIAQCTGTTTAAPASISQ